MTTQAHTPTPWYVDPNDDQAILATPPNGWQQTPQHPRWIVAQLGLYTSPQRSAVIANAALIVQAVNAYDSNRALISEQAAEIAYHKKRGDDNFDSYERVKALYSNSQDEIARLQSALDKIVNIGLVDQADAPARLNECREIARGARMAQEVEK